MPMRPPLYESVADELRDMLRDGRLARGSRLPGEDELARELRVGRSTLREALRALEQEGLIIRRHGIGNFISQNFDRMRGNLESLESFLDSIRRSGYDAKMETVGVSLREVDPTAAQALELETGAQVCFIELLYYGNRRPAILSRSRVSAELVGADTVVGMAWPGSSTREFLTQKLGVRIRCAFLTVRAARAEPDVAALLETEPGAPLLLLEGPAYSEEGHPIYYTEAFFNTDVYQFNMVRR